MTFLTSPDLASKFDMMFYANNFIAMQNFQDVCTGVCTRPQRYKDKASHKVKTKNYGF